MSATKEQIDEAKANISYKLLHGTLDEDDDEVIVLDALTAAEQQNRDDLAAKIKLRELLDAAERERDEWRESAHTANTTLFHTFKERDEAVARVAELEKAIREAPERQRADWYKLALIRLIDAAESYSADQGGATDRRCGLVQPITVAEGIELNDALTQAREIIERDGEPEPIPELAVVLDGKKYKVVPWVEDDSCEGCAAEKSASLCHVLKYHCIGGIFTEVKE